MENLLKDIKCVLLDMDGTVHVSGVAIKGAKEAIEKMRGTARVMFLTNNTSVSRLDYVFKLQKMGIDADESDIYTAGNASVDYLNAFHSGKKVFLLGTDSLKTEFLSGGIQLCETNPELVCIGFDTTLDYKKLCVACDFIRCGVPYLLTHPDINCPVKGGYIPDVGSFKALIALSTGVEPFIVCGKPNTPIGEGIKRLTGLGGKNIMMVGDRLSTDMVFAINNGFVSTLVLSGEATKKDLEDSSLKVDFVLNSIADFL